MVRELLASHPNIGAVMVEAELTCREESTVRQWLSGTQEPNQKAKEKIADLHGRSVDELFKKPSHGKKSATDNQESNTKKLFKNEC